MPTFHEFVAESLGQRAPTRMHRYLVVDTAATRPTDVAHDCALGHRGVDLLTGAPCAWRESASPVLISLPSGPASSGTCKRTREMLGWWRHANCFLYLESPHPPEAMWQMLRNRTDALLPQNLPVLLRYFDARIFTVLTRVLSQQQLDSFLPIASRWAWSDRNGNLLELQPDHLLDEDEFEPPMRFDTAQEAALIDSGEADAMIDLLLNQSNSTLLTLLPPEQFVRIRDALACARALGIDELAEQVSFCSVALDLGLGFVNERPWVEDMPALRSKQAKFSDLVTRAGAGESPP